MPKTVMSLPKMWLSMLIFCILKAFVFPILKIITNTWDWHQWRNISHFWHVCKVVNRKFLVPHPMCSCWWRWAMFQTFLQASPAPLATWLRWRGKSTATRYFACLLLPKMSPSSPLTKVDAVDRLIWCNVLNLSGRIICFPKTKNRGGRAGAG